MLMLAIGKMMMSRRALVVMGTPTPTPSSTVENTSASSSSSASSIIGFATLVDPLDARLTALGA